MGRDNRLVLQDGDRLRLGDYQFRVHLEPIEVRDSLSDEFVAIDKIEPLRRGGEPVPRAIEPASQDPGAAARGPDAAAAPPKPPEADERTGIEGSSRLSAIFDVRAGLHAFGRGAGIEVGEIRQDADLRVLLLAGQLLRESLIGLQALVRAQRDFQARFGTEVPVSARAGTAPDAASPGDYRLRLLTGPEDATHDAVAVLRGWFSASRQHETAVAAALVPAMTTFLRHLDPEGIEGRAWARGAPEAVWPMYVELYHSLSQSARGDLPHLFNEAFGKAYSKASG